MLALSSVLQRMWTPARALWWAAFAAVVLASTLAAETWNVQGREFRDVRVREVSAGTVTIFHRGGITQLELAQLPVELQERFGFDPDKAASWRQQAALGLAVRRDLEVRAAERMKQMAVLDSTIVARIDITELSGPVEFRAEVDLRPVFNEFGLHSKDQGRRPSCSIFAVVGALEYEIARRTGRTEILSEEYLVWAMRQVSPDVPLDNGYHFEEVMEALQQYGVARQTVMPNTFGKGIEEIAPPEEALREAPALRGAVPVWFRRNDAQIIERVVDTLNRGTPVIVGMQWPHWRTLENNNLLRDQKPLEGAGHAVTLVGYRCRDGNPDNLVFIFRNSYGASWGLGGYGLVAASYLREQLITAFYLTLPNDVPENVFVSR